MSIKRFTKRCHDNAPLTMLTCYDYPTACCIAKSNIDAVLVGDTVAMVVHGYDNTTYATVDMIRTHVAAVARGIGSQLIVADLPFLSDRLSVKDTLLAAKSMIHAGAHAVKCEGADDQQCENISALVTAGIPVMGHIGLTPQHVHQLGGYRVQGKTQSAQALLQAQAQRCQDAGCFALVLECVPASFASELTQELSIATIGIGAGADTDGQILVTHDMLGLTPGKVPRFVRQYASLAETMTQCMQDYVASVKTAEFPAQEHTYKEVVHADH